MFQSIWEDIKREFNYGNMITRIIIVNIGLFVGINLVRAGVYFAHSGQVWSPEGFRQFLGYIAMSSDWFTVLTRPWILVTSMFAHYDFWHILWNMLFLFWFGRIFGDFLGNQRVLPLYLLGGFAGSLLYFVTYNVLPYGGDETGLALGASAAVMAIVTGAGTIAPDYSIRLLFLGNVKLKYLVAAILFMYLISLTNGINEGGHYAHFGGALLGFIFVRQLQSGNDWSRPVNRILDQITNFFTNLVRGQRTRGQGPKVAYRDPKRRTKATQRRTASRSSKRGEAVSDEDHNNYQERLDAILDKIKKTGYDSLDEEEKEFLFNASKK
ncbi:MAG TPA: rhomboid family intramembrane serine protease [Saprospiraceae bacterium]|nr:rhomboid family intramembrane serine protease [Saprospiraceae bacterium]